MNVGMSERYEVITFFDNNSKFRIWDVSAAERVEFEDKILTGKIFRHTLDDGETYLINPAFVSRVRIKPHTPDSWD